ncbi:MAG: DUF3300 domain-containing protein [Burkholderiales bacterium]
MRANARVAATQLIALQLCVSVAVAQGTDSQVLELGPEDSANEQPLQLSTEQPADQLPTQQPFTQPELDQMLAPIALYPDALLSQILMASTYPLEVVQAARWSKTNPGLSGDQAVKAVEQNNWDPSVKSMVAFPQIISMMDDKLEWTQRLGDAFLSQQQQVMDTVQELRRKARAAGNLESNQNVRVEPQGQTIVIEPANPQVVYVPYYDPTYVYGSWWYSAYPPVYWRPWPGYYPYPGFGAGFFWGAGIAIGAGFFFGACDWHHHHVTVVNNNYYYHPAAHHAGRPPGTWYHDPGHRRGVPYHDPSLHRQFAHTQARPDARRDFRGNPPQQWQRQGAVQDIRPDMRNVPGSRPQPRDRMRPRQDGNARPAASEPRSVPRVDATPSRISPRADAMPAAPSRSPLRTDAIPAAPNHISPRADAMPAAPSRAPLRADAIPRMQHGESMPTAPSRPVVQSRPVLEGVGPGPVMRDSQRGNSGYQRASPPQPVAQPQRSMSGGARQGGNAAQQRYSGDGAHGQMQMQRR